MTFFVYSWFDLVLSSCKRYQLDVWEAVAAVVDDCYSSTEAMTIDIGGFAVGWKHASAMDQPL